MQEFLRNVLIYVSVYEFCASFCELCDFSWIVRSDAIWGRLCEIAPSRNIRRPDFWAMTWLVFWRKSSRWEYKCLVVEGKLSEKNPLLFVAVHDSRCFYYFPTGCKVSLSSCLVLTSPPTPTTTTTTTTSWLFFKKIFLKYTVSLFELKVHCKQVAHWQWRSYQPIDSQGFPIDE